jgi:hypothetical protein
MVRQGPERMSIPNQFPQLVTAARTGALQALALQAGQMLDGKVIGPAPNGGTQVQIAGQMLNLVLPLLAKAGETLKFEVQGSGAQLRLALQPAPVPANPATPSAPPPLPAQPSNLPLPSGQPAVTAAPAQGQPVPQTVFTSAPAVPSTTSQSTSVTPAAAQSVVPSASPQAGSIAVTAVPVASGSPAPVPSAAAQGQPVPAQPTVAANPIPAASAQPPVQASPPAGATAPAPPLAQQGVPVAQPYPLAAPKGAVMQGQPLLLAAAVAPASARTPGVPAPTIQATPPAAVPAPPVSAPMPSTPQAALAQMVQAALPRQDGITSLTAALTSIAGKVALPEPVVRAAQQVLSGRVAIDGGKLDAAAVQKAILGSGVFQEAALARAGSLMPTPQADMKSALLALRQTLTTWLGQQAPLTPASQIPPPLRGHVPRARTSDAPPIDPHTAPEEVGKQLLERTEAALSRVRLHQNASLPDPVARGADWSMDLPVLIGTHQTLLALQIHRDEQNASDAATERGWQLRFALNLPGMGEVGAQVSLRGVATGVMLWATERETSEALEADIGALRDTLASVGLKPGAIIVRHGEPPAPPPAPSGHLVDAST